MAKYVALDADVIRPVVEGKDARDVEKNLNVFAAESRDLGKRRYVIARLGAVIEVERVQQVAVKMNKAAVAGSPTQPAE